MKYLIDIDQFVSDYGIEEAPTGHKHRQRGWVNMPCPFCVGEHLGYHLGYNKRGGYFNCYRCGWHPLGTVLSTLAGTTKSRGDGLVREYRVFPQGGQEEEERATLPRVSSVPLPTMCMHLSQNPSACRYLEGRRFNIAWLEDTYGLSATGPYGSYRFRVIAPVMYGRVMVSYQGRDYTGRQEPKYKACKKEEELRPHKDCLYGYDLVPGDKVVVVEGVTDAWRLGPGAVATLGIDWTEAQSRLLRGFSTRYILFDQETQAQAQAEKLAHALDVFGGETNIINVGLEEGSDPADLPQDEANSIMEELL